MGVGGEWGVGDGRGMGDGVWGVGEEMRGSSSQTPSSSSHTPSPTPQTPCSSSHTPSPTPQTPIIVGYLIAADRYFKRDEVGYITQMNVLPEYRRTLVAGQLLQAQFDRSAYGCKLYSCWCAQDLSANLFWESMGFVPIAFRNGADGKVKGKGKNKKREPRVHIFWQKRIRPGDDGDVTKGGTPWWYPSTTAGGQMRADRLVFPIMPDPLNPGAGVRWQDVRPMEMQDVLEDVEETNALDEEHEETFSSGDENAARGENAARVEKSARDEESARGEKSARVEKVVKGEKGEKGVVVHPAGGFSAATIERLRRLHELGRADVKLARQENLRRARESGGLPGWGLGARDAKEAKKAQKAQEAKDVKEAKKKKREVEARAERNKAEARVGDGAVEGGRVGDGLGRVLEKKKRRVDGRWVELARELRDQWAERVRQGIGEGEVVHDVRRVTETGLSEGARSLGQMAAGAGLDVRQLAA